MKPGNSPESVRRSISGDKKTVLYFQIPDVRRILETAAFEDIYYEHCSYFSKGSLARLFRTKGFEILDLRNEYDGQYLVIEARVSGTDEPEKPGIGTFGEDDLDELRALVKTFPGRFEEKSKSWMSFIRREAAEGRKIVIWGGGSKCVAFLTTLGIRDEIRYAVDINPHRQGTFLAGSGQEIVAPDFLKKYRADTVIIMNSIYTDEIGGTLDSLGLKPRLFTVDEEVVNDEPVSGL